MPRRVEDIIPNNRRSIRNVEKTSDIKPTSHSKKKERSDDDGSGEEIRIKRVPIAPPVAPIREPERTMARPRRSGRGLKIFLSIVGACLVLGFVAYVASAYFARAVFTLTPREVPVVVNSTYVAMSTPDASSLLYSLSSSSGDYSLNVPAIDGEKISTKATGSVVFYNSYSASPWRLIAGTRLTNDSGRIYRLTNSVSIPGFTKSAAGAIVAGSIRASLTADQPGAEYNVVNDTSAPLFVVAAYAGSTKYASIYAKLVSDLKGGFSGNKKTVAPAVMASTTAAIQAKLFATLAEKIRASIPPGYIAYDQALLPTYSSPQITDSGTKTATVTIHGSMNAILLKKSDLIMKLSGESLVQSFGGMAFQADGLEQLSFAITNAKDFSPVKKNTLVLKLKGNMKLTGIVPADQLKIKFAGISLSETQKIIQSLSPVIDLTKSGGQVVPPWSKIPTNPDKIEIIVEK